MLVAVGEALDSLADRGDFSETFIVSWLPRKHVSRCNTRFARQSAVCVTAIDGKDLHVLASVAEEVALAAILDEADSTLDSRGRRIDMRAEAETAFQDAGFKLLFDPRWDGLEDDEAVADLRMANLSFTQWFRPFRGEISIHPYVTDE